jgi:hypothetical protein
MSVSTQLGTLYAAVVRTIVFAGPATVALGLLGSPAAMAQTCGDLTLNGPSGPIPGSIPDLDSWGWRRHDPELQHIDWWRPNRSS